MSHTSKNVINMTLIFVLDCLAFFDHSDVSDFHRLLWGLGFQVVLRIPCLITSDDSTKQFWFCFKTFDDILTHLHAGLFLLIIQQLWHHFCADFSYALIFVDNLRNADFIYVQLNCDHSNQRLLKITCFTRLTLTFVLLIEGLPFLKSIFRPIKNTCALHSIISILLLKLFKSFWRSFPLREQRFYDY